MIIKLLHLCCYFAEFIIMVNVISCFTFAWATSSVNWKRLQGHGVCTAIADFCCFFFKGKLTLLFTLKQLSLLNGSAIFIWFCFLGGLYNPGHPLGYHPFESHSWCFCSRFGNFLIKIIHSDRCRGHLTFLLIRCQLLFLLSCLRRSFVWFPKKSCCCWCYCWILIISSHFLALINKALLDGWCWMRKKIAYKFLGWHGML
jgi:hypothetical protein